MYGGVIDAILSLRLHVITKMNRTEDSSKLTCKCVRYSSSWRSCPARHGVDELRYLGLGFNVKFQSELHVPINEQNKRPNQIEGFIIPFKTEFKCKTEFK